MFIESATPGQIGVLIKKSHIRVFTYVSVPVDVSVEAIWGPIGLPLRLRGGDSMIKNPPDTGGIHHYCATTGCDSM